VRHGLRNDDHLDACAVKFSLLIEAQIASASAVSERQIFHDCVAQALLADELGYHAVWAVEHHGLLEYSHCSAPEVLLGFIAARTRRIRLGHAVTLTPFRYNHPIRVAERIATLDILSEGRVNWGSGKSASLVEQGAFEIERSELDEQWREAFEMIPRMWRSDVFEYSGKYFNIPPTAIIPKPVQDPHPPLFVACSRPETVAKAGHLGAGSLNFTAGGDEHLITKIATYRAAIAASPMPARRITNRFCCTPAALVLDDDRSACEYGFRGARYFQEGLATYFFSPTRVTGTLEISRDRLSSQALSKAMDSRNTTGSALNTIIGDPTAARESVSRFCEAGVDELILVMQMGTVPQEIVLQSLRVFAERVMPHF
jgi:alkanesulfonate monooxygenase SsuD/methylene tetrahydromethanopterin reductase-like flavin-dependent oxidoreductase (luciferase family)